MIVWEIERSIREAGIGDIVTMQTCLRSVARVCIFTEAVSKTPASGKNATPSDVRRQMCLAELAVAHIQHDRTCQRNNGSATPRHSMLNGFLYSPGVPGESVSRYPSWGFRYSLPTMCGISQVTSCKLSYGEFTSLFGALSQLQPGLRPAWCRAVRLWMFRRNKTQSN